MPKVPITSLQAYRTKDKATDHIIILKALKSLKRPVIYQQIANTAIAKRNNLDAVAIHRRTSELLAEKLIGKEDSPTGITSSNRKAYKYFITQKGVKYLSR